MTNAGRFKDLRLMRRLLEQARPYWWHIAAIFGLGLLATPVALLSPVPLKIAVDSVLGDEPPPGFLGALLPQAAVDSTGGLLVTAIALVLLVALLNNLQWGTSWVLSTYTGEKLVLAFRARLFEHVQRLSLAYHDRHGSTDSTYRIQYDAPSIQWIVIDGVIPFVSSILKLGGMLYVTALIDAELALVALAISPVLFGLTRYYRRRLRSQWREVKEHESSAMSIVQEVIGSLRVVKAFSQEEREHGRFVSQSTRGLGARLRVIVSECLLGLLVGLTTAAGTAAVLYLGVRHVQAGVLSLGELLMVMAYLGQLYGPLKSISQQITSLQKSLASAERAFDLLDRAPEVVERPHARPLARAVGAIEARGLWFAYEPDRPVLCDVSFEIPPGARVGLAGRTGAGKTTLVNLLSRLYDPTAGEILLDGVDLCDYRLADLRRQFGIVLQDPVLLSASIGENIAYARSGAAEEEIVAAARAAGAHDFITQMEDGYDTLVGERGLRLSGGERQRISLARAFLRDAPLLILDEPTSSVDVTTERIILEAMQRLMDGRTTFMIAHRLSTLEHCDLLLVLDEGRLIAVTDDPAAVLQDHGVLAGRESLALALATAGKGA